jgi:hypothetical protein
MTMRSSSKENNINVFDSSEQGEAIDAAVVREQPRDALSENEKVENDISEKRKRQEVLTISTSHEEKILVDIEQCRIQIRRWMTSYATQKSTMISWKRR